MQRLFALRIVLLIVAAALFGRLYQLQMIDSDARRYGGAVEIIATRYVSVPPRRGEIMARDEQTLLAESVPIFSVAVLPGSLPPYGSERRDFVLGELAYIAELSGTLTLSPALTLQQNPDLDRDLAQITLSDQEATPRRSSDTLSAELTLSVPPAHILDAVRLTQVYSDVLTFTNPIETLIEESNVRRYQTVVLLEDVSQEMALALRENSVNLPGMVVVQDYQRRYPQSDRVQSLSHILGHIGRINECELVMENPAASWVTSLMDTMGHVASCGLLSKQIDPGVLARGIPPYRNSDRIGKDGLEYSYEDVLRGELGIDWLQVDAMERPVGTSRRMQPVLDGNNVILTIDIEFQMQVETIIRRWIAESEARRAASGGHKQQYASITSGAAVAFDVHTGEVLAMVSLPTYSNNLYVDSARAAELQNMLSPADPEAREQLAQLAPLTNRAIAGQYPPGSTMKQFVGATALQSGIIMPDTVLYDPGVLVLRERSGVLFELPNAGRRRNNEINIIEALEVSSNVFFASIAGGNDEAVNLRPDDTRLDGLAIDGLTDGLTWFGFGQPTGIQLAGEAIGRVPTPNWKAHTLREPWTTGDTYNMAIGQGYLEVTPIQLVRATAAVANNGIVYRPQLVKAITDSSGQVVQTIQPEEMTRVPVDPAYLAVIREGMRRSVTEGANVSARDNCSGLSIAGKTGTAEYGPIIVTNEGELIRRSHSWFVGFAPYDDPQIAVVVLLEGTGDLNDGSATLTVPAVTQIMQVYFGITPPAEQPGDCPVMPS